jgi:hypothetical protein
MLNLDVDLPDLPDQLEDEALLNGGPDVVTGDNTFGLALEDLPF